MNKTYLVVVPVAVIVIGAGGYGVYRLGMNRGMELQGTASNAAAAAPSAAQAQKPGDIDPATGKKVLYWHDPMAPGQKFDKPGKSPFMDMQLVPVYADSGGDEAAVAISPRMQQSLGVRTAEVKAGSLDGGGRRQRRL